MCIILRVYTTGALSYTGDCCALYSHVVVHEFGLGNNNILIDNILSVQYTYLLSTSL